MHYAESSLHNISRIMLQLISRWHFAYLLMKTLLCGLWCVLDWQWCFGIHQRRSQSTVLCNRLRQQCIEAWWKKKWSFQAPHKIKLYSHGYQGIANSPPCNHRRWRYTDLHLDHELLRQFPENEWRNKHLNCKLENKKTTLKIWYCVSRYKV